MISKYSKSRFLKSISITGIMLTGLGLTAGFADSTDSNGLITKEISSESLDSLSDKDLISLLTHEDYYKREEATQAVWKRGRPIIAVLEEALASRNPELLSRANKIISYIKVGISPETPSEVVQLVQSFPLADRDTKQDILRELYGDRRYSLMLYMLSNMDDQKEASRLYSNFRRLAHSAAREFIIKGEIDTAIEQFKLSPKTPETMRSLAYLYKHTGVLKQEIAKLEKSSNKDLALALNLSNNDRSSIRDYAKQKGLPNVLASLDLLEGNSDAIVEILTEQTPHISQIGLSVLQAMFEGGKDNDKLIQTKLDEQLQTLSVDILEPYLIENLKTDAFGYFSFQEQPTKALEVIGINDEVSLNEFIDRETKIALKKFKELKNDESLPETARKVISPLLQESEKLNNKEWQKLISYIAYSRMHKLALILIWATLQQRKGVSRERAFRDLSLIMSMDPEQIKECLDVQDELLSIAKAKGGDAIKSMHEALASTASLRQDGYSYVKFTKQLLEEQVDLEGDELLARKRVYLHALLQTLDRTSLLAFMDKEPELIEGSPRLLSLYSIAKRKSGDEATADKYLKKAMILTMGLHSDLMEIAEEHAAVGYYELALSITEPLFISVSSDYSSIAFKSSLRYLVSGDNEYIQTKQWHKASAAKMVEAVQEMIKTAGNKDYTSKERYLNIFYNLSFTRGMELYQKGEKAQALKMLHAAHSAFVGNGTLADHFYPAIRTTDLDKQYELWVEESFQHTALSIEEFPKCGNTYNTMAWILSRAIRKLDEALIYSRTSHELSPNEAAYLDTMAEVWHAKGDRKKAIEWGEKAVSSCIYGRSRRMTLSLAAQLERFRTEPHPKP